MENEFAELDEMIQDLTETKNKELINEDDYIFPEERQTFMNNEMETPNINVPNFRKRIIEVINKIIDLIECTDEQKKIILSKSKEILNRHILRAENNDFTIPKNANLKKIASTIIWTVSLSTENMPKITRREIVKLAKINTKSNADISNYYKKYFEHLYPRIEFRFSSYSGFKNIRNIISLYLLELIKKNNKITEFSINLKERVLIGDVPKKLTQEGNDILYEMVTKYENTFIDYFSDLAEVVSQLVISSEIHKKIGAHLVIKYIAKFLSEKDINLSHQNFEGFYESVKEIFDFLKEKFPSIFPNRSSSQEREVKQGDYERIVSSKLKLYILKNIYNGRYYRDRIIKCPECVKEGFIINTRISRIINAQFHHSSSKKENKFTEKGLYDMFTKNQDNPRVLEFIIRLMESEKVEILCRNHHHMLSDKYFNYFKYIINWENIPEKFPQDIFSLSSELIHILIKVSINNFHKTRHKSRGKKKEIKRYIVNYLKKRYILRYYGIYCPTCGEFNITEHLPIFHFIHFSKENKTVNASDLYSYYSCSEIAQILEKEKGMYICPNCHTIFDYEKFHLLDKIYDDKNIVKGILEDFNNVSRKIKHFQSKKIIGDPLKKSSLISNEIVQYLTAINDISMSEGNATHYTLADYMGIQPTSVFNFFNRNDIIKQYIDIKIGRANYPSEYTLNKDGVEAISLINHIRDYYTKLKF